jgi:hypothetical protein
MAAKNIEVLSVQKIYAITTVMQRSPLTFCGFDNNLTTTQCYPVLSTAV